MMTEQTDPIPDDKSLGNIPNSSSSTGSQTPPESYHGGETFRGFDAEEAPKLGPDSDATGHMPLTLHALNKMLSLGIQLYEQNHHGLKTEEYHKHKTESWMVDPFVPGNVSGDRVAIMTSYVEELEKIIMQDNVSYNPKAIGDSCVEEVEETISQAQD